jgi:hypothetical protein
MAEFQIPVAFDAGIGRQTPFVAGNERIDHSVSEFRLSIKYVEGDSQSPGNCFRVSGTVALCSRKQAHHGTDAGVSTALHQVGGNRTVHTAAHGDQSLVFRHGLTSFSGFCLEVYQRRSGKSMEMHSLADGKSYKK